MNRVNRK